MRVPKMYVFLETGIPTNFLWELAVLKVFHSLLEKI